MIRERRCDATRTFLFFASEKESSMAQVAVHPRPGIIGTSTTRIALGRIEEEKGGEHQVMLSLDREISSALLYMLPRVSGSRFRVQGSKVIVY